MPSRQTLYLRDFLSENGPGVVPEAPNVHVSVANHKDQALLNRAFAKVQQTYCSPAAALSYSLIIIPVFQHAESHVVRG